MFERMGTSEDEDSYVVPGEGDVWDFIGKAATWIRDPCRNGMPQ